MPLVVSQLIQSPHLSVGHLAPLNALLVDADLIRLLRINRLLYSTEMAHLKLKQFISASVLKDVQVVRFQISNVCIIYSADGQQHCMKNELALCSLSKLCSQIDGFDLCIHGMREPCSHCADRLFEWIRCNTHSIRYFTLASTNMHLLKHVNCRILRHILNQDTLHSLSVRGLDADQALSDLISKELTKKDSKLTYLCIKGTALCGRPHNLLAALCENKTLETLHLLNPFAVYDGDSPTTSLLGKALILSQLKTLKIMSAYLLARGDVASLAAGLIGTKSLQTLWMHFFPGDTKDSVEILFAALNRNTTLTQLNLRGCEFRHIPCLTSLVNAHTMLKTIWLQLSTKQDEEFRFFLIAVQKSRTLQEVYIESSASMYKKYRGAQKVIFGHIIYFVFCIVRYLFKWKLVHIISIQQRSRRPMLGQDLGN